MWQVTAPLVGLSTALIVGLQARKTARGELNAG